MQPPSQRLEINDTKEKKTRDAAALFLHDAENPKTLPRPVAHPRPDTLPTRRRSFAQSTFLRAVRKRIAKHLNHNKIDTIKNISHKF